MTTAMQTHDGLGLAANQIGYQWRIIAVKNQEETAVWLNPRIIWLSPEKTITKEGCLSLPDLGRIPVERRQAIRALVYDLTGRRRKIKAEGLTAKVIQHEIDHLNGLLITDRLTITGRPVIVFLGQDNFGIIIKNIIEKAGYPLIDLTETPPAIMNKQLKILRPAVLIVANYGQILPKEILKIPKCGCLNIHPSLLPQYRGASPLAAAIIAGRAETGVTIIKMDEQIDHGPVATQEKLVILPNDTNQTLGERAANLGGKMLIKILPDYLAKKIKPVPQDDSLATFTKKITKEVGLIDWRQPAKIIERQVRAYAGWPGSYTILPDQTRLIIHQCHLENNKLVLDFVQRAGKKPMSWADFRRGYHQPLDFEKILGF